MIRRALAILLVALPFAACAASNPTEEQTLVDRSTLTVQDVAGGQNANDARDMLRRAKGVLVCPRIFKAGFFFGGEGGGCVMVGRLQNGWTYPAFYTLGSGSFGLQIGIQDAEILFVVLTDRGLRALLDSQFKVGANAGIAIATIGAGVSGSTTAALRADVVAFALARGAYAGISLDGSLISQDSGANQGYYGQSLSAQQIVLQGQGHNPGADPLREMLAHFAGG